MSGPGVVEKISSVQRSLLAKRRLVQLINNRAKLLALCSCILWPLAGPVAVTGLIQFGLIGIITLSYPATNTLMWFMKKLLHTVETTYRDHMGPERYKQLTIITDFLLFHFIFYAELYLNAICIVFNKRNVTKRRASALNFI